MKATTGRKKGVEEIHEKDGKEHIRTMRVLAAALIVFGAAFTLPAAAPGPDAKTEPKLIKTLVDSEDGSAPFFVVLGQRTSLETAFCMSDWAARGQFVVDRLQAAANRSQNGARGYLQGVRSPTRHFGSRTRFTYPTVHWNWRDLTSKEVPARSTAPTAATSGCGCATRRESGALAEGGERDRGAVEERSLAARRALGEIADAARLSYGGAINRLADWIACAPWPTSATGPRRPRWPTSPACAKCIPHQPSHPAACKRSSE